MEHKEFFDAVVVGEGSEHLVDENLTSNIIYQQDSEQEVVDQIMLTPWPEVHPALEQIKKYNRMETVNVKEAVMELRDYAASVPDAERRRIAESFVEIFFDK